jgi:hypothetical protein
MVQGQLVTTRSSKDCEMPLKSGDNPPYFVVKLHILRDLAPLNG